MLQCVSTPVTANALSTLRDFEARARELLDPAFWDDFVGDETANETAFGALALIPRILRGAGRFDAGVTLFGKRAETPIFVSPTTFPRLVHPAGEQATARAAATAGNVLIAAVSIEDVAADARKVAADPTLWFQLDLLPDLDLAQDLVRAAEDAGCRAVVAAVDSAASSDFAPSWEHIDWLRGTTGLPIVLRGVLNVEDALLALHHGLDGLMVANNGGRLLDSVVATIDQLPAIVDAVHGRIPVLLDGGVRRGTDVIKALALGASAVGVGNPVIWGLAVGGEQGVTRVLELLRAEFEDAMRLCGVAAIAELHAGFVRAA
jgi:4-hydroxymandelate oxidase